MDKAIAEEEAEREAQAKQQEAEANAVDAEVVGETGINTCAAVNPHRRAIQPPPSCISHEIASYFISVERIAFWPNCRSFIVKLYRYTIVG